MLVFFLTIRFILNHCVRVALSHDQVALRGRSLQEDLNKSCDVKYKFTTHNEIAYYDYMAYNTSIMYPLNPTENTCLAR